MESDVKIKATVNEIYTAFQNSELYLIKYYEPREPLPTQYDKDKDIFIFNASIRYEDLPKNLNNTIYTLKGLDKAILRLRNSSYEVPKARIIGLVDYTIPMFGNKRCMPYGKLKVTDGVETKIVSIKDGDASVGYKQYFTFNRKRYYIRNEGSMYAPNFVVIED